ncbi:MAG: acyl carrier protein [Devosia sp.]|jgi:acyl carrier protein|uniref:acyl carrier protein n=1 Tax=Devosia sp. TaxID=1871048 RepID=UPI001A5BB772|nr:acyl carrier protein [Devosia sp.]MBL8596162.1 acyl carrier protein [Devosia sp.]
MNSYEQPILDFVAGVAAEAGDGAVVARDTPLLETGMLDSINLVRLIQFIEERFGISVPDSDFGPDLFESPASLAAYVERRKQG